MSDIKITSINISNNSIVHKDIEIEKYKPPTQTVRKTGRKYEAKDRMVYAKFLEKMFFDNEIGHEPKTDRELKYEFLASPYGNSYSLRKRFQSHKESIGAFRTHYNKRILSSTQEQVLLISFTYSNNGRIVASGRTNYDFLSFSQCYQKCIEYKIADPRFIEYKKIVAIRNAINNGDPEWAEWTAPTDKQINTLCSLMDVQDLYNCVSFLQGFRLGD